MNLKKWFTCLPVFFITVASPLCSSAYTEASCLEDISAPNSVTPYACCQGITNTNYQGWVVKSQLPNGACPGTTSHSNFTGEVCGGNGKNSNIYTYINNAYTNTSVSIADKYTVVSSSSGPGGCTYK